LINAWDGTGWTDPRDRSGCDVASGVGKPLRVRSPGRYIAFPLAKLTGDALRDSQLRLLDRFAVCIQSNP